MYIYYITNTRTYVHPKTYMYSNNACAHLLTKMQAYPHFQTHNREVGLDRRRANKTITITQQIMNTWRSGFIYFCCCTITLVQESRVEKCRIVNFHLLLTVHILTVRSYYWLAWTFSAWSAFGNQLQCATWSIVPSRELFRWLRRCLLRCLLRCLQWRRWVSLWFCSHDCLFMCVRVGSLLFVFVVRSVRFIIHIHSGLCTILSNTHVHIRFNADNLAQRSWESILQPVRGC